MYLPTSLSLSNTQELQIYSDASERAIASVAYLFAMSEDGTWSQAFLLGKAKIAPKSGHTIPRLELCAAVLAVEIYDVVVRNLAIEFSKVSFFTDSKEVLGYIRNKTRRFYTYVTNRVDKILKSSKSNQWFYVRTEMNPADCATRPYEASKMFDSPWLSGPVKFTPSVTYDDEVYPLVAPDEDKEIRPVVKTLFSKIDKVDMLGSKRFERFSSWSRLVSALSFLIHVVQSFKNRSSCSGWHRCSRAKSVDIHRESEKIIVRSIQKETFSEEISRLLSNNPLPKDSALISLDPVLDNDRILRVGGRLKRASFPVGEKNPIIIPKRSHIAILLVRHFHQSVVHQGRHFTEGAVRSGGFWIVGCKKLVSSMIASCVQCKRLRGKISVQKMADLPPDRLSPSPPFSFVGVDAFGPWEVVARRTRGGQACSKRWGIMFTCLTTRAVHIELVESMSASSFINAMRRLMALRGPVLQFRSDRGTNFVGAVNELSSDIESVCVEDCTIQKFLTDKSCVWLFNPPHASHMGGVWERMIGVTRNILNSMLLGVSPKNLSHEVLCTLMAEVTAIINGRPLIAVSNDPESPEILTPASLVTQKPGRLETTKYEAVDTRIQWKHVQSLADAFWRRWRSEYLHTLQIRKKWESSRPNLKVGDVVLLKDKEVHRNSWPLGTIVSVYPSSDNKVRKVEVRIFCQGKCQNYIRPISEVILLLSEK